MQIWSQKRENSQGRAFLTSLLDSSHGCYFFAIQKFAISTIFAIYAKANSAKQPKFCVKCGQLGRNGWTACCKKILMENVDSWHPKNFPKLKVCVKTKRSIKYKSRGFLILTIWQLLLSCFFVLRSGFFWKNLLKSPLRADFASCLPSFKDFQDLLSSSTPTR